MAIPAIPCRVESCDVYRVARTSLGMLRRARYPSAHYALHFLRDLVACMSVEAYEPHLAVCPVPGTALK